MGFYELGNGCDSCDTVQTILPNNINMQIDPNSAVVASMAMPYGTQNNVMRQYNNNMVSSGYSSQGSNMGLMGNGSTGSTLGATQMVMVPAVTTTSVPATTKQVASVVVPS